MKLLNSASIGVLSLLLGIPAVNAQEPEKPKQEEPKPEQNHQGEARPQQQNNREMQQQEQNRAHQNENPAKQDEKAAKQEKKDENKRAQDEARPQENRQEREQQERGQQERGQQERAAQERGMEHGRPAGKSARIPEDRFRQHFGRQHTVVINRPVVVEGQPRFQYGGYWFVISDPWPPEWAYTDECYIDDVDGEYYLYDLMHPGVRIALFVVE